MKRLLLLIACVASKGLVAQHNVIDSLSSRLLQDLHDTDRVNTLVRVGGAFRRSDLDTSIVLTTKALDLATQADYKKGAADALLSLGIARSLRTEYTEGLKCYARALKLTEEMNDRKRMGNILGCIGNTYNSQADYPKALDHYFKALAIAEEADDKPALAMWLGNIGTVYTWQGEYSKARDFFLRAVAVDEELGNKQGVARHYINIGNVHYKQASDERGPPARSDPLWVLALDYYTRSLKVQEEMGDKRSIAVNLCNIAMVYSEQAKSHNAQRAYSDSLRKESLDHYFSALRLMEEIGAKDIMTNALDGIGALYAARGMYKEAEVHYQRSLALSDSIGDLEEAKLSNLNLSQLYDTTGRFELALEHYRNYVSIRDTIDNDEKKKVQFRTEAKYEFEKKEAATRAEQEKKDQRQRLLRNSIVGGLAFALLFLGVVWRQRNKISKARQRSDELLLNILPEEVAEELKAKGEAEAVHIDQVTVLFTDFKGFTAMSEMVTPKQLVKDLHECFSAFDHICEKHRLEKIKTIGDAYMAAGGLPTPNTTHATDVINAALEMRDFVAEGKAHKIAAGLPYFEIRIGIHTGPVVAGIVGVKKFQYDIWGDTVNTASRMESSGEVGQVNISEATYRLVVGDRLSVVGLDGKPALQDPHAGQLTTDNRQQFHFTPRGKVQAKGKGEMEMYFVSRL